MSFQFFNSDIGMIVGHDGILRRTTDGGENWENLVQGTTNQLLSVYFTDPNIGFAVGGPNSSGAESVILKTTNGGRQLVLSYLADNEYIPICPFY